MHNYKHTPHPHVIDKVDINDPMCRFCNHKHYVGGDYGKCYKDACVDDYCKMRFKKGYGWKLRDSETEFVWKDLEMDCIKSWREVL